MPSPAESRAVLQLVTAAAVDAATQILKITADPAGARTAALDMVPALIAYYQDGSSALAADFYDQEREQAAAAGRYAAEPIVVDRMEKIGRAVAWATAPLVDPTDLGDPGERLAEVVQLETARPYRDTIRTNVHRDPAAVGWERVASGSGCKMCRMLADRGAVYKQETANFATHGHCHCTARPVFEGQKAGPEANVMQYTASKRRHTQKDRETLRNYLNEHFPDARG